MDFDDSDIRICLRKEFDSYKKMWVNYGKHFYDEFNFFKNNTYI
jgi:hypothetical protein